MRRQGVYRVREREEEEARSAAEEGMMQASRRPLLAARQVGLVHDRCWKGASTVIYFRGE